MSNLRTQQPYFLALLLVLLSACSSSSDPRPEPVRQSEYYLQHGVNAFADSDYVAASDFFRKALAHYRSIDDTRGVLLSHINLAETALATGNLTAAQQQLEAAGKIANSEPYRDYQPRLTLLRAQLHWRRHDRELALAELESLLPPFDLEGRSAEKADLLQLGATTLRTAIAFTRDDDDRVEAHRWLQRLSLMRPATEGNSTLHLARQLRFEAQLAADKGQEENALHLFDQALQLYREAAVRPALAATLSESGRLLMQLGRWDEAAENLQRALYIRLWIMDRQGTAELLALLQLVYRQLGDEERYQQLKTEAEKLAATR